MAAGDVHLHVQLACDDRAPGPELERMVDADLLARLLEGDETALRDAFDRFGSLVHGIARRVTGDSAEAADVCQDVFVRLWERPERVDLSRGSLRAYLAVVAHRRALDIVRGTTRARRRDEWVGSERGTSEPSHENSVVDDDHLRGRAARLQAALTLLPDEQRAALELAYFGGLTYREVAVRLDVPEGTAKSRMRLALARLRDLLDETDAPFQRGTDR